MTIESAIENLANAINNLAVAYSDGPAPQADGPAPQADGPAPQADVARQETPAARPRRNTTAKIEPVVETPISDEPVVDAGTGKPLANQPVTGAEVDARTAVKSRALLLTQQAGGNDTLTALLRKHSGVAEGAVKIGMVPDDALAALGEDIESALSLAD